MLSARYPHRVSYYDDWADAFDNASCFRAVQANVISLSRVALAKEIEKHDLVVLLHSCTADTVHWLLNLAPALADRKRARLIAFVGNEYNSPHSRMAHKIAALRACRPDVIATQLLGEAGRYLYADIGGRVVSLPHAVNPDVFRPGAEHAARPIDIGVRNFRYSPLIGDQDRNRIIEYFASQGAGHGLTVDYKEDHRFGRQEWAAFLRSCRGTISSEAGSWYLERDDALVMRIAAEMDDKRSALVIGASSWARQIARRLPAPVKDALGWLLRNGPVKYAAFEELNVDFAGLYDRFFREASHCPVHSKAISSRHLEAAGTQTCQILIRGRYNDILVPGEHYIPVAPDLIDAADAVACFKDESERQRIALTAYNHVLSAHTYAHRMVSLYDIASVL